MTARTRHIRSFFAVGLIAFMATTPVRAQNASLVPSDAPRATTDSSVSVAVQTGPTAAAAAVGVRTQLEVSREPLPAAGNKSFDKGVGLMIVGGAAVLTGIVVGNGAGHAISVVGAVVGLYGLWQYVQ